jgi:hypothetical protein
LASHKVAAISGAHDLIRLCGIISILAEHRIWLSQQRMRIRHSNKQDDSHHCPSAVTQARAVQR